MAEEIKRAYQFDFVHDGQKIFRKLLDAVANPGEIKNIEAEAGKFQGKYKSLLALGCTLLDNEEKMYVEKNPNLSAELHSLTLCRESELDTADYIFLSSEMNYGSMEQILRNVKHGTYADPQTSATVLLLCTSIEGEEAMTLRGPGIKEKKTLKVYPYIKRVIGIYHRLNIEYLLGVDLVFADEEGNILGIPRLVKMEEQEEESWHMLQ